ncbi:MAG: 3-deoxy-D-manno-octulosonic acid transferase [Flavobacteriaceae bacterium]|nr:3-deoxy-D-manno-octulosonic acid transferase [Flavobacteriaceae bacterium]
MFNKKVKLFLNGRKETFNRLSVIKKTDKVIWFHCASLGEFEQGKPILENLKTEYSNHKIVLTFFSPSGYEIKKNYKFATVVCYLPLDTKRNAKRFLTKIHPEIAIFVKYEFWPTILKELKSRNIKTLLVAAIFRKKQVFFKSNGVLKNFMQNSLRKFEHLFVQDQNSKYLLNSIGLQNVTISGDTRFDSVYKIANQDNTLDFMEKFISKKTNFVLVAGSTWEKDEELLINYINNQAENRQQFIIAPHHINAIKIKKLKNSITKKTILYSDINTAISAQVLIIDTIGLLTKIYSYADVAYVGGGFGKGIHNILEPATFGVPIIIGPKYNKFNEAIVLVAKKGCLVVRNYDKLKDVLNSCKDKEYLSTIGGSNNEYVRKNTGATLCIITYIKKNILTN